MVTSCSEGGVLGPIVGVIGSMQALEVIKIAVQGKCKSKMDIANFIENFKRHLLEIYGCLTDSMEKRKQFHCNES